MNVTQTVEMQNTTPSCKTYAHIKGFNVDTGYVKVDCYSLMFYFVVSDLLHRGPKASPVEAKCVLLMTTETGDPVVFGLYSVGC